MQNITPDILLRAYARGLFPMAQERADPTLYWIDPDRRGIIPLDGFHVPRRLARTLRRQPFAVHVDRAFGDVVAACAAPSPQRADTWINDEIMQLYRDLHAMGHAHSVECWHDGRLAGGLYGVSLGGAFFGESMFSAASDASKIALGHLVDILRGGGYRLLDTQFLTDHLKRFGAVEISKPAYMEILEAALAVTAHFPSDTEYQARPA